MSEFLSSWNAALTPELSRTAARHGGVVHVTAQAEPRSGLGLNELLGGGVSDHIRSPERRNKCETDAEAEAKVEWDR